MGDIGYRLYLDDKPASKAQLDQVEEITVQQAVGTVWEARLTIPICADDKGNWGCADASFLGAFGRVRVEVDAGSGTFVPLIDGPVVGVDQGLSSEPGQSTITTLVNDDSVYLNRQDKVLKFEKKLDHEIASQIYRGAEHIADTDIDSSTKPPGDGLPPCEVQRGTEMQILRRIASRHNMFAYVLPGGEPGKSVGVFKPFPQKPDGLPPLILLGPDRNVGSFTSREDSQSPATVTSASLSITDKGVTKAEASVRDVDILGDVAAGAKLQEQAKRMLPPGQDGSVDVDTAVKAAAQKLSYAFEAQGTVIADCYAAALIPYRVVTVKAVGPKGSGDYEIRSVTHRLTRSSYTQSFALIRNASSEGAAASNLLGEIF
ncbi:hypothetical protein A4X20_06190 [Mycolicibacterium iranicum]|uniref:Phage protein D n=2 Tax=Mycolicibacterium iranicum TaxID=912594 RepID=A0A178LU41_MYCIR|nr:hypothetical protein A4X20_06190 [Mycolicibacterium iranicum]